jgi:SAM-dependent methyltransferase
MSGTLGLAWEAPQRDPNVGATLANPPAPSLSAMTEHELTAMIAADERHWWYRGRRRVLDAVLAGLPVPRRARVLDAGCGSGRTLDDLARYGSVTGVDLSPVAARAARRRGHDAVVGPVESLPYPEATFDLVTCLDVIEHTPDDRRSLRELARVTKPGGRLVVTVPAHPALWSAHDEANLHYRRYTRRALVEAAVTAGLDVVRDTYFNSAVLAPAALVRLGRRRGDASRSELAITPRTLDGLLELPLRAEAAILRRGGRVPAGLSLLAVLAPAANARVHTLPARPAARTSIAA